ncbi:set domain-containing protein [Rutstroemia sp. NJR-2017a BBW]|nr:set domain-containing protein [Rutstroemia sp. NJR-2017a BBW]
MHPALTPLPLTSLPAWCKLNGVSFLDTTISSLPSGRGNGIVSTKALNSLDTYDIPTLLEVGKDVVLDGDLLLEMQRVDKGFRDLGECMRRKETMLFLLMQITNAVQGEEDKSVGLSNPWTEYVRLLPEYVPIPTMWSEEERLLLAGTSLESAVQAKMAALVREFEELREKTSEIPWCNKCWWDNDSLTLSDWIRLDAWFRSRSLELPTSGEVMVPCLDMANHSSAPNGYYEQTSSGDISLLLRPNMQLQQGTEITISYGSGKSDAEMLFSYGFIDRDSTIAELVLDLEPMPEDPLGKAKVAAFRGRQVVRIWGDEEENIHWESSFLYLLCLNEEDGLEFKVLQEIDGSRSPLRVFWQGSDVTESTDTFESLIRSHELVDIFKLRAVTILQDRIRQQLERLYGSEDMAESLETSTAAMISEDAKDSAMRLRRTETAIMEAAYETVETEKTEFLKNESVLKYLGAMDSSQMEDSPPEPTDANDEEDFS